MTRVRSDFQFEVHKMWVAGDALGGSIDAIRDGWEVRISLPKGVDDFGLKESPDFPMGPFGGSSSGVEGTVAHVREVVAFRVSVWGTSSITGNDLDTYSYEALEPIMKYAEEALAVATAVAADFVGWARVRKGQSWLGLSHHRPRLVGTQTHWDETLGKGIRFGGTQTTVVAGMQMDRAVGSADLPAFGQALGDGRPDLPLGEVLLEDGKHLLGLDPPNPSQAVLLAAIGTEVKIKEVLWARAPETALTYVEYILERPRDVTQAAASLVDHLMKIVAGRSLRDENKPLYIALNKLFEHRNIVAHRAGSLTVEEATADVQAASDTFGWLASL